MVKDDTTEIYNTVRRPADLIRLPARVSLQVFSLFGDTNPLHADVFPDIRTMEAEVVRCVATMFHGDADTCGTVARFSSA